MKRQRSPVSVAAASSLSAAFLAPLIGDRARRAAGRPRPGRPPGRPAPGWYSQWNGRASAMAASPSAAVPRPSRWRRSATPDAGARACWSGGRGRPRRSAPRRSGAGLSSARSASRRASWAFSRSISQAMSAVSAMTTTLSGRTWRKPPTIANDSSAPPLRIRSSPTPEHRHERRVVRQDAELALAARAGRRRRPCPRRRAAPA